MALYQNHTTSHHILTTQTKESFEPHAFADLHEILLRCPHDNTQLEVRLPSTSKTYLKYDTFFVHIQIMKGKL